MIQIQVRDVPRNALLGGLALFCAFCFSACGQGRIIKVTPEAANEAGVAYDAERGPQWQLADSLWESRSTPRKAWAALVAYREAVDQQPDAAALQTRYARACYFLATYTEQNQAWSNPERSKGLYLEGARAAESALRLHPGYLQKLAQGSDEMEAIRAVDGQWLEPAFWLAASRGRWALGEGRRTRMDGRDRLGSLVQDLAARGGSVYHGGPDRFLGVMFLATTTPKPDSARVHFERAATIAPLFFANFTLRAQYLAVYEKDSTGFRTLLETVLSLPADALPEVTAENTFEQARARDLLARQAEFFP